MNIETLKYIVGIDVSKDSLSISIFDKSKHITKEIKYNNASIKKELVSKFKSIKDSVIFVMEATGIYHTKLALLLYNNGFNVSVVNPLSIKRYAQLKLSRVKTDKADAKLIALYGYTFYSDLIPYIPNSKDEEELKLTLNAIDDLNRELTVVKNQYHSLKKRANASKEIIKSYTRHIEFLKKEIKRLKLFLNKRLKDNFNKEYELLNDIPGVGLKVSSVIVAIFNGFKRFKSAKQACSYAGITPSPFESGSSVRKRGSISKKGNPLIRKTLYMATLSAIRYNKLIKEYYERLVSRGKEKMVAIIACANKLLRIAFGVLKSGNKFSENYVRV